MSNLNSRQISFLLFFLLFLNVTMVVTLRTTVHTPYFYHRGLLNRRFIWLELCKRCIPIIYCNTIISHTFNATFDLENVNLQMQRDWIFAKSDIFWHAWQGGGGSNVAMFAFWR